MTNKKKDEPDQSHWPFARSTDLYKLKQDETKPVELLITQALWVRQGQSKRIKLRNLLSRLQPKSIDMNGCMRVCVRL